MKIADVTKVLAKIAPVRYQEDYDNAGLITGRSDWKVTGVLTCLDATEEIIAEAKERNCNLVVAHHPIVFRGLKKINGNNYVERTIIKAIKEDIAIYAIHTNLDNVIYKGVNTKIAERIGLKKMAILAPKAIMETTSLEVRAADWEEVKQMLLDRSIQFEKRMLDAIVSLRLLFENNHRSTILNIARQFGVNSKGPFILKAENKSSSVGSGMIGTLEKPMEEQAFLQHIKDCMQVNTIRHTSLLGRPIKKVAICGGAGSFLLPKAMSKQADIFITADYKYHEFFDAEGKIIIADIGHYESEQFTIDLLHEIISETFSNFAVYRTQLITNPVHYF